MIWQPEIESVSNDYRYTDLSVAVLSGGQSRRMNGTAKGLLPFGDGRVVDAVLRACAARDIRPFSVGQRIPGIAQVPDRNPPMGPLGGVERALRHADTKFVLCAAWDYPFFDGRIIDALWSHRKQGDVVLISVGGKWQTGVILVTQNCRKIIEHQLSIKDLSLKAFVTMADACVLTDSSLTGMDLETAFFNMNTEHDYRRALEWLK